MWFGVGAHARARWFFSGVTDKAALQGHRDKGIVVSEGPLFFHRLENVAESLLSYRLHHKVSGQLNSTEQRKKNVFFFFSFFTEI